MPRKITTAIEFGRVAPDNAGMEIADTHRVILRILLDARVQRFGPVMRDELVAVSRLDRRSALQAIKDVERHWREWLPSPVRLVRRGDSYEIVDAPRRELCAQADPEYEARLEAERVRAQWKAPITRDELAQRGALRRRRDSGSCGSGSLFGPEQPEQQSMF